MTQGSNPHLAGRFFTASDSWEEPWWRSRAEGKVFSKVGGGQRYEEERKVTGRRWCKDTSGLGAEPGQVIKKEQDPKHSWVRWMELAKKASRETAWATRSKSWVTVTGHSGMTRESPVACSKVTHTYCSSVGSWRTDRSISIGNSLDACPAGQMAVHTTQQHEPAPLLQGTSGPGKKPVSPKWGNGALDPEEWWQESWASVLGAGRGMRKVGFELNNLKASWDGTVVNDTAVTHRQGQSG